MKKQPDFVNAVAELDSSLEPEALLAKLLDTEHELGRTRTGPRWGPRVIDLDLLTYGERIMATERLQIPHPRLAERAFVLVPLLDLEPGFSIPGAGPADECLQRVSDQQVHRLNPS